MSELIASKISAVKRKHGSIALGTAAAMVVCTFVAILGLTMLVDWLVELPYWVRVAALAVNLSACVYIVVRYAVVPVVYGPDDEQVSLWVEEREPTFASRLITTVQLSRDGAVAAGVSRPMLAAMVRQTEALAEPVDFTRVVSADSFLKLLSGAVLLIVVGLVVTVAGGQTSADLLKRAMLVPGVEVPRKTRVVIEQGDVVVAKGDDVVLTAVAEGVVPNEGEIVVRYDSGRKQTIPIEPANREQAAQVFSRSIQNVQESFSYTVYLNDGHSKEHRVRAETRPAVAGIEIQQIFPAYTGLAPMRRSTGDLAILEGSRLTVRVKSNKPVKPTADHDPVRNHVFLVGSESQYRLEVDPADPTTLVAVEGSQRSIPVPKNPQPTTGFSVHLVDEFGLQSKDPAVYRIDLQPDRPPTVRVTHPDRKEELVTSRASIVIGFDAADDFAIGAARVAYEIRQPDDARQTGGGLAGVYYDQADFAGKQVTRTDPTVDFTWDHNRPHAQIEPDSFSIRWTGYVIPPEAGSYTFLLDADDGVRLWIDDRQILDSWQFQPQLRPSTGVEMEAGRPYKIRLDLREDGGGAKCRLMWRRGAAPAGASAAESGTVVPATALWPSLEALDRSKVFARGNIKLELGGQRPKSLRGHHTWDLAKLEPRPPVNSIVEWWVEVEDTNNITGPGIATSDRHLARIVSEDEKRADLMRRLDEAWTPIDTIAEDQKKLNQDLGQMIVEQGK